MAVADDKEASLAGRDPGADRLWGGAVVLLSGLLFASTWTDAVQAADSGELIAAACNLGVAHPPGYPLYTLLGHLLCGLPWSTPAGRLGWLSVAAGIWAALMVYATVLELGRSRFAAAVAALTLATGSLVWRYASLAEVFALNAALCLSVVYCAVRAARPRLDGPPDPSPPLRPGWSFLCGLCGGLALSNHHSSVLVAPLAAAALLWPLRPARRSLSRAALGAAGLLLGLLPYLQLYLADPGVTPRWGDPSTLEGLVHHVLRRDYGTFTLLLGGKAGPLQNVGHFLSRVPSQLGWLLWPLAPLGMLVLLLRGVRRPLGRLLRRSTTAPLSLLLGLSPLLAGPAFLLLFNIGAQGIDAQVAERFFILPLCLLALCLGVGLALLDHALLRGAGAGRAILWRATAWAVVGLSALGGYGRANVSEAYVVEDYARNALASAESGGLILGEGDVRTFSLLYAQSVLGMRPDVQYLDVRLLLYPWYVAQKRAERPALAYRFQAGNVDTLGLIQRELDRGVPVYLAAVYNRKVHQAFAGYPVGPLIRLLPPGRRPPPPAEVARLNKRLFSGFSRRGRLPERDDDPWSSALLETYARTWQAVGRALYRTGDRRGALAALVRAQRWAPWLKPPDWFGVRGAVEDLPRP